MFGCQNDPVLLPVTQAERLADWGERQAHGQLQAYCVLGEKDTRDSESTKEQRLLQPGLKVGRNGHGFHPQLPAISCFPASDFTILSSLSKIVHDCKALELVLVLVLYKQTGSYSQFLVFAEFVGFYQDFQGLALT